MICHFLLCPDYSVEGEISPKSVLLDQKKKHLNLPTSPEVLYFYLFIFRVTINGRVKLPSQWENLGAGWHSMYEMSLFVYLVNNKYIKTLLYKLNASYIPKVQKQLLNVS